MGRSSGIGPSSLGVAALGAALVALTFSGCIYHPQHSSKHGHHASKHGHHAQKSGPPPWAPAHGHRHKHSDAVELVFDAELGVYAVLAHAHHYFHGNRYYRHHDGRWEVSARIAGPWGRIEVSGLPLGLRHKVARKRRGHDHHPPAKHK